jgi:hypothetical protein
MRVEIFPNFNAYWGFATAAADNITDTNDMVAETLFAFE